MTIEKSPPSTEAKPAAASDTKGAHSAKGKSGKSEGADAGGFMAILATVDTELAPAVVVDSSSSVCLGPPDAMLAPQVLNPVDVSNTQAAMDAAALLAQAAQLLPTAPTTQRDMSASQMAAPTAGPQALNPLGRAAKGLPDAAKGVADAATPVALPLNQAADSASQAPRKPARGQPDLNASAQLASSATASATTSASAAADARAAQVVVKAESQPTVPVVAPALLAAVVNSVRREDEKSERSALKSASAEAVPGATASAPAGSSIPAVSSTSATASPADLYVAEQVKYWISNDVKNAEMKLDGIGNNPVEVSISMQGNEAHVAFRSDESQARDVLEAASSHLKDLLQREGLVLSGVSVGTTGSGDASSQERREQQSARQARAIAATQSASSQAFSSGARASGRALDLFV